MRKPKEMSPMKAMMGMKKSSTPSARASVLKRATGKMAQKTGMKTVSGATPFANRMKSFVPLVAPKKVQFGEKQFGPKLKLDVTLPGAHAQSTPMTAPVKPVTLPPQPAPTKKVSAKALRKAAAKSK